MKTKKHRIEGANMGRIEELASAINYRTPDWVPYTDTQHFSGLLRDCSRFEYIMDGKIEDENGIMHDLENLLDDAAERLDQAHQEWLETQVRTNTLEAGLAAGVEAVQALIDNPRRAAISGLEDWATRAGDELPDAAADPQPAITILWGECPQPEDEPVTYTFNTDAELQAFIDGIEAGDGWMGYEVISDEPEDERCDTCGAGPDETHPQSCYEYDQRVIALEAEGMTRSDAQAVADAGVIS